MVTKRQQRKLPAPRARTISRRRPPKKWNHTQIIFFLFSISGLLTGFIGLTLFIFISLDIPDIASIASYNPPVSTFILNSQDEIIDIMSTEDRQLVSLKQVPDLLPKAFVAAEDARFFQHAGVDGWSILRAFIHNMKAGGRAQGGSTITQQVARALLLSPRKTYLRKIKEAILAYRIDKVLSKNDIIHIYLNQIYLGDGAYGVGAAARIYFDKQVQDLTLAEMSLLAGLPQAPSRYSPRKHLERARKRQAYVLNRMAEDGYISAEAARKAFAQPIVLAHEFKTDDDDQYFLQQIRKYLTDTFSEEALTTNGFVVYTTLDSELQKAAMQAVHEGLQAWAVRQEKDYKDSPQAALVGMENATGKIRALVGGKDFRISQFNRAVQAQRQPGSAFKPFVYAAALNLGFTPNEMINDEEVSFHGAVGERPWVPKNFSGRFYGPTTLRNGLVHSRNIVTIKLLQEVGIGNAIELAHTMGIQSPLAKNLALALGSSELNLLELTSAYNVFASAGKGHKPVFIEKITDKKGTRVWQWEPAPKNVLSPQVAFQMTSILEDVITRGTGKKAQGLKAAAGKTGTTDQNMDAWFLGYTDKMTTGVWVGHDKYRSLGRHETGGRTAAPIWLRFMKEVDKKMPAEEFSTPAGITFIPVHRETGDFEYIDTDNALWEAFRKDNLRSWKDRLRR